MSVGELCACVTGCRDLSADESVGAGATDAMDNRRVAPDNRCCFCLTLKTGVIAIGISNFLLYLIGLQWLLYGGGFDHDSYDNKVYILIIVVFTLQMAVNVLLIYGSVRRKASCAIPWLLANCLTVILLLVLIFCLVFFGTSFLSINYQSYVSCIITLSLIACILKFCCIVVFQFRANILMEERLARSGGEAGEELFPPSAPHCLPSSPIPPPPYTDAFCKPEEEPPDYETAMALQTKETEEADSPDGPVLRKKSLTNQHV